MQINELIDDALLENKTIEYKGIIEEGKNAEGKNLEISWLKTIVAFANTSGGSLFIGVEDKTHKVVALDQQLADKTILMIHRLIKQRIEPTIDYDISNIVVKESKTPRYIIRVDVRLSKNLPVALHSDGMLGIYIRNFGRTDLASQEQIRDLVLLSDNTPYDTAFTQEIYNPNDFQILQQFAATKGIDVNEKLLISKGIISEDKKLSRGILLFKDSCLDLRTKIVMTLFPGETKGGDIINATEEYVGNLLQAIEKVTAFVKNHSIDGYKKLDETRTKYFSYPARSVLEGIVNAIGHRNYYLQGSQIEVNIFINRLEITSPGSLLGVRELYHEKNISSIVPRRRNDVICAILEICRFMEERGSGFDKIESDYADYGEAFKPYVSADATSFTLTLPDLTKTSGLLTTINENNLLYTCTALEGKYDSKILNYCYSNAKSIVEIAKYLNVTPSTYFRKQIIASLIEKGLLKEIYLNNKNKLITNKDKVIRN